LVYVLLRDRLPFNRKIYTSKPRNQLDLSACPNAKFDIISENLTSRGKMATLGRGGRVYTRSPADAELNIVVFDVCMYW
jgi:hypothetical protein